MTVTEAPRDVADVAAVDTEPTSPTGLAGLVGSGDPRSVGKLFVGTALLFLLVSVVAGSLVGFEQVDLAQRSDVVSDDTFAQVFTLHTIGGLLLGLLPLLLGLATAVVPLQVGASTVAFPRASAAAYWTYLVSGGLILAAYAVNGGPFGGDEGGVALFVVALIALLAALCVGTISVVTTVITLRTPGMTLRRTPLFSWSMLVAGAVWLLTLPVLGGVLLLVYLDFTYGQLFLDGATGIYDRIAWLFWQPTVYAFAIPALGIVGDIVPVFAQTRHKRHGAAMVLIGLFGAVSFGAWTQFGVRSGDDSALPAPWLHEGPWTVVSVVALVALLGLLGLWTATLAAGRPRLASPLLFALAAGALLVLGLGLGIGTMLSGLDLVGTTWMTGQMYAVLTGSLVAALGGLVFWAPKLYGSLLGEAPARLVATLLLLGTAVVAGALAVAGLLDQPDWLSEIDVATLDDGDTIEVLNLVGAIGGVVVLLGVLLAVLVVLAGVMRRRPSPGDDPWSGHTLEWATSSPPPVGNFATLPEITSEAPVYDARHAAAGAATTETAS
jgi:heme/copper-type cytochrome/quinol oxidase subunit 1